MIENVAVPERLVRAHRFVAASRDAARAVKPGEDGRMRIGGRKGVVYLVVSREQLQRALLILQALFKEAERRGYELREVEKSGYEAKAGVAIYVREHAYRVQLVEQTARVPLTEDDLTRWHHQRRHYFSYGRKEPPTHKSVANGRLKLQLLGRFGGRSSWGEGPRGTLESKLGSIIGEFAVRATHDDEQIAEQQRRADEWRRQEEERQARELRARLERARAARLNEEVRAWHFAREVSAYVVALRARLDDLEHDERRKVEAWCSWAEDFGSRSDPTLNTARIRGLDDERDRFYTPPRHS